MKVAALALVEGWGDPIALLKLPWEEFLVAMAVLEEAAEISLTRRRGLVEAVSKSTGAVTANAILKGLKHMFGKKK